MPVSVTDAGSATTKKSLEVAGLSVVRGG